MCCAGQENGRCPRLSIITPVYNTADYLEETVNSILAQTFSEFELILVDDGSTDGSGTLCDMLAKRDPRIRVIHKENGGVASARNVGLDAARGDYIGWVDSDDWISPVMYQTLMETAQRYDAKIVQCEYKRKREWLVLEEPVIFPEPTVFDGIGSLKRIHQGRYSNYMALWSKIYRRELYEGLRFTEGRAFEDDECVPLLLYRSDRSVFLDVPMYRYTFREGSIVISPNVENVLALTEHLETRMFWFEELDPKLFEDARAYFYRYLLNKICEKQFIGTAVQKDAVEKLKKHRLIFWPVANHYDKITILMLYCGDAMVQWVAKNDFAPIQNILAKVKKLIGK